MPIARTRWEIGDIVTDKSSTRTTTIQDVQCGASRNNTSLLQALDEIYRALHGSSAAANAASCECVLDSRDRSISAILRSVGTGCLFSAASIGASIEIPGSKGIA